MDIRKLYRLDIRNAYIKSWQQYKTENMALKFTTQFKIKSRNIEFVDIPIDNDDLLAFIDPILIEENKLH